MPTIKVCDAHAATLGTIDLPREAIDRRVFQVVDRRLPILRFCKPLRAEQAAGNRPPVSAFPGVFTFQIETLTNIGQTSREMAVRSDKVGVEFWRELPTFREAS